MYKPAPPRKKKTDIVRSRTGCKSCRERRTKCDEKKPSCGTCARLGKSCEEITPAFSFRSVNITDSLPAARRQHRRNTSSASTGATDAIQTAPHARLRDKTVRQHETGYSSSSTWPHVAQADPSSALIGLADVTGDGWTASKPLRWPPGDTELLPGVEPQPIGCEMPPRREVPSETHAMMASSLANSGSELVARTDNLEGSNGITELPMCGIISPERDPVSVLGFYREVWRQQCIPALGTAFHDLEKFGGPASLVNGMIIALSACRLSRALPQRKLFGVSTTTGLLFRPDAGHESISHNHYGAVMQMMAKWTQQDFLADTTLGPTVTVLFCLLESSMGNFRNFRLHSEATIRLLQSYPDWTINQRAKVFAAWIEVDMQNWWRRVYFSTPDFHRSRKSLSLPQKLEAVLSTGQHQRANVLLILCESHRLSCAALVSLWERCDDEATCTSTHESTSVLTTFHEYQALLKAQSVKLDAWFGRLKVSDLADYWHEKGKNLASDYPEQAIEPLHFKSHASAMNFAYYITARVLQCLEPLESLHKGCLINNDEGCQETERWIQVLLRIAAGIDWEQCVRLNTYKVGFASLLLACALRTRRLETGLWMQNWLDGHLKGFHFEEGNFPVFQILGTLRLINHERMSGRDVLALFQTMDDQGGSGKLGSYHSQRLSSLWIYGRCRRTGVKCSYRRSLSHLGLT